MYGIVWRYTNTLSQRLASRMPPPAPWFLPMLATLGVQSLVSLCLFVVPVIAPRAAADLGVDPALVGGYTALAFAVGIVSSLAAGDVVRRWGAVRTSQGCLLLSGAAAALAASGSLPLFALGAALLGAAFGVETPASSHLLARVTPPARRPLVFSLKQTGNQYGGMAAGFFMPAVALTWGWQAGMAAVALLCVAAALLLEGTRRRYDDDRVPGAPLRTAGFGQALWLVVEDRALRRLALGGLAYAAAQLSLNTFLVSYGVETLGLSLPAAGIAMAVAQTAGLGGRIGWGFVAGRWCSTRTLLVALGVMMSAAGLLLALAAPDWPFWLVAAVCGLFGLSASGWNGIFLAEIAHLAPEGRAGEATGGMLAATFTGLVVGPLLFGAVVSTGLGYAGGYALIALASLAGAAALLAPARAT